MLGKVAAASGAVYLLTFEHHILPYQAGFGFLVMSGAIVVIDVVADGPQHRLQNFVDRCEMRAKNSVSRRERELEIRQAAREELRQNHGIRMPEELTEEDREWLRKQAVATLRDHTA